MMTALAYEQDNIHKPNPHPLKMVHSETESAISTINDPVYKKKNMSENI